MTTPAQPTREPWFGVHHGRRARTILVQALVWLAVLTGPLTLLAQVTRGGPAEPQGQPERSEQEEAHLSALAVSGWAEQAVAAYVEGDHDTVRTAFPEVTDGQLSDLPNPSAEPTRVSALTAEQVTETQWTVTVAVHPQREDAQTPAARHLRVTAVGSERSWAALSLPTEVGAQAPAEVPSLDYSPNRVAESPLTETVQGWASAYLTGDGELDRYLAPEARQAPPPAAHEAVDVDGVYVAPDQEDLATTAPGEGTTVSVLVDLVVTAADGQSWPMSYALELTSRSERWEVSAVATTPLT